MNALESITSVDVSNPVLVVPKSNWALVSIPVVIVASAEEVKSTWPVVVVVGYSPNCKPVASEVVSVVCNTSTEAKSSPLLSTLTFVEVWKSVNSFVVVAPWKTSVVVFIWVSKPISFVVVWNWLKSSVVVGIASTVVGIDVSIAFVGEETGYSPYEVASPEGKVVSVFMNVSILQK